MPKIKYIFVLLIIMQNIGRSEDTTEFRPSYILFGNFQQNYHKTSFSSLPGVPSCCPDYESGEGPGFSFGLNYQFPLPYKLSIGIGIGYYDFSGDIYAYETKPVRIGNIIEDARIKHTIESSINDIGFTPYISYNLTDALSLTFGGHIGMILNGTFHQYETLIEPGGNAVFKDTGTRTRNDTSGTIPSLETVYSSLFAGISYDFRLYQESVWIIAPSLTYNWGRSNIVKNLDWSIDALMIGFQLKYSPTIEKVEIPEKFERVFKIDTLTFLSEEFDRNTIVKGNATIINEQKSKFGENINIETIIRTDTLFRRPIPRINVDIDVPVLHLEGQFVTQAFPLVPIVFFNNNSDDITVVYNTIQSLDGFDISDISINSLAYQKEILNIIGSRMRALPESNLFIAGYCDSISEGANFELSKSRVKAVSDYLISTWLIEPSRLRIKEPDRCFPKQPTITQNDSGFADNRRVELSSDSPELLSPIRNKKYIEPIAINPPMLKIDPQGSTKSGIESWSLLIRKGKNVLSSKSGKGYPGILTDSMKNHDFNLLFSDAPITIEFSMLDFEGQEGRISKNIPVKADTSEYELQRLSLILFEVGNENLNERAKSDILNFLNEVNVNSQVWIKGYTDPLGSEQLNKSLSSARARNTADFIRNKYPKLIIQDVTGLASEEYPPGLDSYHSPIERFLSRTVFIEVMNKRHEE